MSKKTIVKTKHFNIDKIVLESGKKFGPITIAFETYGKLNRKKSNAILILHALTGDAHAAGFHRGDKKPGWWDDFIGREKAFDTDKYFIICSNVLGGCKGSTGPSSINPKTQKPYGLDFPMISVFDMVTCQKRLIDYLGIDKLLAVAGGSMGGMQVLSWLVDYPDKILSTIAIATTSKHSPQQIAFNEVGRQAIMADPNWKSGNYYDGLPPDKGLAVARMIGHITYMSDKSMMEKFGKDKKKNVEGYLRYRGDTFVKRFDANSYLYITRAIDNFDASRGRSLNEVLQKVKSQVLIIAFKSDWLYPAYQSQEIVKACKLSRINSSYCEIFSTYGHDAFLLEVKEETHLIKHFLKKVSKKI